MNLIFPSESEVMMFFRNHFDFHTVYRISELLIVQHHNNVQNEEWQHIRMVLHRLKSDGFLIVKNEGGNIYEEQFGSTPDRVDRYFDKQTTSSIQSLQHKTDEELKEIMRASIDNQHIPQSQYHKARLELEFGREPSMINNGIIARGSITAGGDIESIHSNNLLTGSKQKSWWKQPKFVITTILTILGLIGTYASSPLWSTWFDDKSSAIQSRPTLKGPLTINSLANVQVPDFATEGDEFVTLSNGEYKFVSELSPSDYEINGYVSLLSATTSYAYSDFNNDGMADVTATLSASNGGSGTFYFLAVFLNNRGLPEYATSYYLGDRISVESVHASGSDIFIDIITQGLDEPMCCGTTPKSIQLSVYGNSVNLISEKWGMPETSPEGEE